MALQYSRILYGATCWSMGAALWSPEDTLVLEPGMIPGAEFSSAFHPGKNWNAPLISEPANEFRDALRERGALDEDGHFHLAALFPMLARTIRENSLRVLLGHTLMGMEEFQDRVVVRTIAPEGTCEFVCERFCDTLTERGADVKGQEFCALLSCEREDGRADENIPTVIPGALQAEAYLHLSLPDSVFAVPGKEFQAARAYMDAYWSPTRTECRDWRIDGYATRFARTLSQTVRSFGPRVRAVYSANFDNPALALDAAFREG